MTDASNRESERGAKEHPTVPESADSSSSSSESTTDTENGISGCVHGSSENPRQKVAVEVDR